MKVAASPNPQTPARKEAESGQNSGKNSKETLETLSPQIGMQKMPPDPESNNIRRAETHNATMTVRRSYGMVVSSYENVAKRGSLTDPAAEQFAQTVDHRVRELNEAARKQIEELPEYKSLGLDDLKDLGDELGDLMQDPEQYTRAFALLKTPGFAQLMESTESVHRSFAEMMESNGKETLMFGVFEMIRDMGGLARSQESQEVMSSNGKRVNIQV
jgi:hypothetical protein